MYTGTPDDRIQQLKAYSERYDNKKIWLTEFAMAKEGNETKIVEFVMEFLPLLEHADFIHRYAWYYPRYYENHAHEGWFWIDSYNSLLHENGPYLTAVGEAYNFPWHLEKYRPCSQKFL